MAKMTERRYGQWTGNEKGRPEDPKRCIVEVWPAREWFGRQCARRRGHGPDGLYCKQHAKQQAKKETTDDIL